MKIEISNVKIDNEYKYQILISISIVKDIYLLFFIFIFHTLSVPLSDIKDFNISVNASGCNIWTCQWNNIERNFKMIPNFLAVYYFFPQTMDNLFYCDMSSF